MPGGDVEGEQVVAGVSFVPGAASRPAGVVMLNRLRPPDARLPTTAC